MYLRSLHVENFRCLEDVTLDGLDEQVNVLIGPNNSGKSSLFRVLEFLGQVVRGVGPDGSTILTGNDKSRVLKIVLGFTLRQDERERLVGELLKDPARIARAQASPFLRQVEYEFRAAAGQPALLHLMETRVTSLDGRPTAIQTVHGGQEPTVSNPQHMFRDIASAPDSIDSASMDVKTKGGSSTQILHTFASPNSALGVQRFSMFWPLVLVSEYLGQAFFFNPFRHGNARHASRQVSRLDQNGANLAGVLHTIQSNNRPRFATIEEFVRAAIPGLGDLQTPLIEAETEVGFLSRDGSSLLKLQDMGGGVEELLMVATTLATTTYEDSLFIEEPENHLHPGAQRFLLERVSGSPRQVFLTTHSPVFVNAGLAKSVYRVEISDGRTRVARVADLDGLASALGAIGVRNSDVLMSEAVVFVEGPSDADAFLSISKTLSKDLVGAGVQLIATGGADPAIKSAPLQASMLASVSKTTPIPHLFILDRDERSDKEIALIKKDLGPAAVFLESRELENYLLVPRAIREVMLGKAEEAARPPIQAATDADIMQSIRKAAASTYGLVLVKRVRTSLPRFVGGMLPRQELDQLASQKLEGDELAKAIEALIRGRSDSYLKGLDTRAVVKAQQAALDSEWKDDQRRLALAAGEEVLTQVFRDYGVSFNKRTDTPRLAAQLKAEEIPGELAGIVARASELSGHLRHA